MKSAFLVKPILKLLLFKSFRKWRNFKAYLLVTCNLVTRVLPYHAKICHWTHPEKVGFNSDLGKQAQEVSVSRKVNKDSHPPLAFSNNIVCQPISQKHLGIILGNSLSFEKHLALVFSKINKTKCSSRTSYILSSENRICSICLFKFEVPLRHPPAPLEILKT